MAWQTSPLWKRIQAFEFDEPNSRTSFSKQVAEANGWTADFAQRTIEEYRRFAFLALVAGHNIAPSKPVNQVWHLHMIVPHSKWEVFCEQVLETYLQDDPDNGAGARHPSYADLYSQTLDSYRLVFEEDPPADIWPG